MTELFKKLNYKNQKEVVILNAPPEFKDEVQAMEKVAKIHSQTKSVKSVEFILVFVKSEKEVTAVSDFIDEKTAGDGIVWFAFPKGTSKKYKAEIGRDKGWSGIKEKGFDTVRAVAIDEDWSALRFRRVEFIKK